MSEPQVAPAEDVELIRAEVARLVKIVGTLSEIVEKLTARVKALEGRT